MSALTRIERFDEFFPEMFRRLAQPLRLSDEVANDIRLDVTETDKGYQVRAELPGVKKEDIRVTVNGNFVSISAEVRKEKEEKSGSRVLLKETYFGSMSRGFALPQDVDGKNVVAKLDDGVLKLTLPKHEGSGSRTITVQ